MAKSYYINGNSLVSYGGGELGYSQDKIQVQLEFHHKDIYVDDFGPQVPALVLQMLSEAKIVMTLVYWDQDILRNALRDAMALSTGIGTFAGAGKPLSPGELTIASPTAALPWTFAKAYLTERPYELPLGNEYSALKLSWRAVGLPATSAAAEPKSADTRLFTY